MVRSPRRCAVPMKVILMIRCGGSYVTLESANTRKERTEVCTNIARQGFAISPLRHMLIGRNEGSFGLRLTNAYKFYSDIPQGDISVLGRSTSQQEDDTEVGTQEYQDLDCIQ